MRIASTIHSSHVDLYPLPLSPNTEQQFSAECRGERESERERVPQVGSTGHWQGTCMLWTTASIAETYSTIYSEYCKSRHHSPARRGPLALIWVPSSHSYGHFACRGCENVKRTFEPGVVTMGVGIPCTMTSDIQAP